MMVPPLFSIFCLFYLYIINPAPFSYVTIDPRSGLLVITCQASATENGTNRLILHRFDVTLAPSPTRNWSFLWKTVTSDTSSRVNRLWTPTLPKPMKNSWRPFPSDSISHSRLHQYDEINTTLSIFRAISLFQRQLDYTYLY